MAAAFMLYAQGLLPFLLPLSVLLFEPDAKSRRRMLPFFKLGGATSLYILWALIAYPMQDFPGKQHRVHQSGQEQHGGCGTICHCDVRFTLVSKVRPMVIFGPANVAIMLIVMAVKRYAFTSVWCAYAAVASVIILPCTSGRVTEKDRSGTLRCVVPIVSPQSPEPSRWRLLRRRYSRQVGSFGDEFGGSVRSSIRCCAAASTGLPRIQGGPGGEESGNKGLVGRRFDATARAAYWAPWLGRMASPEVYSATDQGRLRGSRLADPERRDEAAGDSFWG